MLFPPLSSSRCHLSYDDCLQDKRENCHNCFCCVVYDSCAQWYAHTYEQFLQVNVGLGLSLVFSVLCILGLAFCAFFLV